MNNNNNTHENTHNTPMKYLFTEATHVRLLS